MQPSWITCVDYILCSHDHKDHYDRDTVIPVLKANPGARIVIPFSARPSLLEDGISEDDILACQAGRKLMTGNICIEAIPGKHNGFDYSIASGYPYLGYIVRMGPFTLYHAGDTLYYEELPALLARADVHMAFVPVNGWDEERRQKGFASNMMYSEAAELCRKAGIRLMIPCHYDMFTLNTEQIGKFVNYVNNKKGMPDYWIPVIGEMLLYKETRRN